MTPVSTHAKGPVLLVDDQSDMRESIAQFFDLAGYKVQQFSRAKDALPHITKSFEGIVLSDIKMPDMDGNALLQHCQTIDKELPVILITGHGDVPMAVVAMRSGAYDFIEKPFDPELLVDVVARACDKRNLVLENRRLRHSLDEAGQLGGRLVGTSDVMHRLREDILTYAQTDASILIIGETGTGKELVARALHNQSNRKQHNFAAINCAAIPDTMFESEMFGHEAGAFTGANAKRQGWFERADKGTLFLDELSALPFALQPKLLRALQEREITRLGGTKTLPVDLRVISATNLDLEKAAQEGTFRADLLYRLNSVELHLPPLRERGEDALILFDLFTYRFGQRYNHKSPTPDAADRIALLSYNWPGNVRQLINIAERYVLRNIRTPTSVEPLLNGTNTIDASANETNIALKDRMDAFEAAIIRQTLNDTAGNIAKAMEKLDLPRRTLNEKMAKYAIERSDFL
ncbi:MAG: sigma-54 dependent transcriptional regulator [Cohaesibacter sp.]|nr:sigma-54 dependent transcriptional regulator [Cohaesibacter sp.]